MSHIRSLIAMTTALGMVSCACRTGSTTTAPSAQDTAIESTTTVLTKNYKDRGRFVVSMEETAAGKWRNIVYAFRLFPNNAGAPEQLGEFGFSDPTPIRSGEPHTVLIQAELTRDPALAEIYLKKYIYEDGGSSSLYEGVVHSLDESTVYVPSSLSPGFYVPPQNEQRRTALVTGSLTGGDLTVELIGQRDTLRFRLVCAGDKLGWFSFPQNNAQPGAWMAPALPAAANVSASQPATTTQSTGEAHSTITAMTTIVLNKDSRNDRTLIVEMRETASDAKPASRDIQYSFQLVFPDQSKWELTNSDFADSNPVGSGEPTNALIDAEFTPANVLVGIYYRKPSAANGTLGEYSAYVYPIGNSQFKVPATAYSPSVYRPSSAEPRRKAVVTGSLGGNDLTLCLIGPKDTLRFRYVIFHDNHDGWYSMPGNRPPQNPLYIAPALNN